MLFKPDCILHTLRPTGSTETCTSTKASSAFNGRGDLYLYSLTPTNTDTHSPGVSSTWKKRQYSTYEVEGGEGRHIHIATQM